ncbi:hypothetical protein INR49_023597, partial [Caranx melampygus]
GGSNLLYKEQSVCSVRANAEDHSVAVDGGVCGDFASCSITCPDGNAVCCPDLATAPAEYRCNMVTKMCEKEKPAVVEHTHDLENSHISDEGKVQSSTVTTITVLMALPAADTQKAPGFVAGTLLAGAVWDGYHCCPYGYDCDLTYTHCIRDSLRYPFSPQTPLSSVPASLSYLLKTGPALRRETCCKGATGEWGCCPYPLGQCCADGKHCCQYGYSCDALSMTCRGFYSQVPSGAQEEAKTD